MEHARSHRPGAAVSAGEGGAGQTLPGLLLEQLRLRPDATAVVHGRTRLSFRQLVRHSRDLAAYLRHLGVGPDDRVGIFVAPSPGLLAGVWGTLFAGAAYLPLSPEYPPDRIGYMIDDSRATVVLTSHDLRDRLTALAPPGTRIVTVEDAADFARSAGRTASIVDADGGPRPGDLAYVIYTSGSTGRPKGVMIEHRAIVSQMRWLAGAHGLDHRRRVLQKTPMSFDAAQWEILASCCGSTVVVADEGAYRDPRRLVETIVAHRVTTLQCVPTLLQALLDLEDLAACGSLGQVFSGGEALPRRLALRFLAAMPDCALVNLYGPTECTINASSFTVDPVTAAEGPQTISIGGPVAGVHLRILDADRSPVAVGEIGELYIGGVQVARGYLHRPDLTAERFIDDPDGAGGRLYRTGDLAYWNADGTVQFAGRTDNQVKLRGFRVELDEIRHAIEVHDWVKNAAVVIRDDARTGHQNLVAFVELNPAEAALMDQGRHEAHHRSKEGRLQLKAQLSNPGCREDAGLDGRPAVDLPGRVPSFEQRRRVFQRKSYRFFDGGAVGRDDLLRLLDRRPPAAAPRAPESLALAELGGILRYFGQFHSIERLLPKYGYASPGALYATQLYLEVTGVAGLAPGHYYYHPARHQLVLIRPLPAGAPGVRLHFIGKRSAIEPVYKNNVREVLEIEAGHLLGLFDEVLPGYGLSVGAAAYSPAVRDALDCPADDFYLGSFALVPGGERVDDPVDVYVQAHPGGIGDLPGGLYRYTGGELARVGDDVVQRRHVIAINQQVYQRASFGVSLVSRSTQEWRGYLDLGRAVHRLQANDAGLGLMSSGYSSKSGNDLPSATRLTSILRDLGQPPGPSYFVIGGRVSEQQIRSTGMQEDAVHMKGPAELIKDDLVTFLPDYMMPNRVIVLEALPQTANGKIDIAALKAVDPHEAGPAAQPPVPPRTPTQARILDIWRSVMRAETASVRDDFFAAGGNSLLAVALVNRLNERFGTTLPLQVVFQAPTIEQLARAVTAGADLSSRVVPLREGADPRPVFCWPGLGGYVMNLRPLAEALGGEGPGADRPFYGIQAHGLNESEAPYATIAEMAARDVDAIRRVQPSGPYTLWGYSFGARVAFEAAYQLEQLGERVENLVLIAPGAPRVEDGPAPAGSGRYGDRAFVAILYSVFAGRLTGPGLDRCLAAATGREAFVSLIAAEFPDVDTALARRIVEVVELTYRFDYSFEELRRRRVRAPVTIFKARGDDYSSLESARGYCAGGPAVVDLATDHYGLLRHPGVEELVAGIRHRLDAHAGSAAQITKEVTMPHVSIKHFPAPLDQAQESELVATITRAVTAAFHCDPGVVSIALEPVEEAAWQERVYQSEIVGRSHLLRKTPNY